MFFVVRFASQFDNDISLLLNSFLFHVLGKALNIKDVFDQIQANINSFQFYEVALQYGRMLRTVFYFDKMEDNYDKIVTTPAVQKGRSLRDERYEKFKFLAAPI